MISSLVFEQHLLLLGPDRLHVLNPTARLIWEGRDDGIEAIARQLCSLYGIPAEQARSDVRKTLSAWQQAGLLDDSTPVSNPVAKSDPDQFAPAPPDEPFCRRGYRLGNRNFCIEYGQGEVFDKVAPLFAHVESACADPALPRLCAWRENHQWWLQGHDGHNQRVRNLDHLALGVVQEAAETAYRSLDWLMVAHAGAVSNGDACLLMAAPSGSGKSTLSAALNLRGWPLLGDDVVPIERRSGHALAVPLPLNLKPGSLEPLRALALEPGQLHPFDRGDVQVHYLPPRPFVDPLRGALPVKALIYPRYQAGCKLRLQALSAIESLQCLIQSDCMLPLPLTIGQVEELTRWVRSVPAYILDFDDLDQACEQVENLLNSF